MNGVGKLKEKLKNDKSFKEKFKDVKNEKEAVELAKKLGFEVSEEDILKDEELNEDMLEAVAGGNKGDTNELTQSIVLGNVKDRIIDIDGKGNILRVRKKEKEDKI